MWAELSVDVKAALSYILQQRQRGTEVAWSCKGQTNPTTHITTLTLIEQGMTGLIIVAVSTNALCTSNLHDKEGWGRRIPHNASLCLMKGWHPPASNCCTITDTLCIGLETWYCCLSVFYCDTMEGCGGGRCVALEKAGKSINNEGFRVRLTAVDWFGHVSRWLPRPCGDRRDSKM